MKHIYSLAAVILLSLQAISIPAQQPSKINPAGRILIQKQRNIEASGISTKSDKPSSPARIGAIVRFDEGLSGADIIAAALPDVEIITDLDDIITVKATADDLERIAALPQVKSISAGNKRRPHLNVARSSAGVEEAHSGIESNGNTTSYTGRGVIVGLMDGGLDPNHINFLNSDGTSRVKRLWHFEAVDDYSTDYNTNEYTADNISKFTTDSPYETHATHVAGIIGGSYSGTGTYIDQSTKTSVNGNIPFRGVAYEADFAMSCGEFLDDCIINGVSNIVDYAASVGKPAAINLSLGSNYGPHDGTDDFSQALSKLGKKALISLSAGNEGTDNMSIQHTFTSSTTPLKTILFYNNAYTNNVDGVLDIWADDDSPITVTFSTVDASGNLTTRAQTTKANQTITLNSTSKGIKSGGEVDIYSLVDSNNGRYNVCIIFNTALPTTGRFAISVQGKAGQKIDMFFSGYTEFSNRYSQTSSPLSGFTAGTPDYSINGMACGDNIIAVGSYNTSVTTWKTLDLVYSYTYNEIANEISSFSSYGTDFNGRKLPHIAAPGSVIASSYSRHYISAGAESANTMVGRATNGSNTDYWGMMQGTSMSSPFCTGTLALFLQADPTLTFTDVLDILSHSATTDSHTQAAPERFGFGKIDAAKGLKYILAKASIGSVTADEQRPVLITPTANGYDVTIAGETSFTVTLTDMQGRIAYSAKVDGPSASVSTAGLQHGIYIIGVNGTHVSHTEKVTVR